MSTTNQVSLQACPYYIRWMIRIEYVAMTKQHLDDVQDIEERMLSHCNCKPRPIAAMIANGTHSGIVAFEQYSQTVVGYIIYARATKGIYVNGEYGVVVDTAARRRGIGRQLLMEIAKENKTIIFEDINLYCGLQRTFLKSLGVAVPVPEKFATVEWQPVAKAS